MRKYLTLVSVNVVEVGVFLSCSAASEHARPPLG